MKHRKILTLISPKTARLKKEILKPLKKNEVLIRSLFSSIKHGTEMSLYRGSNIFIKKILDSRLRVFLDKSENDYSRIYPHALGNITVGVIEETGEGVSCFSDGDIVFGWLPIADWHITPTQKIYSIGELTIEQALCIDPAIFALGAVLDANVRCYDKVLITGLGAIGLLSVQYAKLLGATVYASSSFSLRQQTANKYGADVVINTQETKDLGVRVKELTNGGVDATIECSGNYSKLHQAIRATRQGGRVVCVGFYSGDALGLYLGEEFFHNRISLLASLPDWSNPVRSSKPLYKEDLLKIVIKDFILKRLTVNNLLKPEYMFNDALKALEDISENTEIVSKVLIKY